MRETARSFRKSTAQRPLPFPQKNSLHPFFSAFKNSLKFIVRTFIRNLLVGLLPLKSLGFVELHYGFEIRTLNAPLKLLVSTSSHVQVARDALIIDRPDPLLKQ